MAYAALVLLDVQGGFRAERSGASVSGSATPSSSGSRPRSAGRRGGWRYDQEEGEAAAAPRTPAEWVSLVISLVLLAGVVGAVLALWLEGTDAPARCRVERGPVRYEAGHYHLPMTVANEGDATGAQVTVEGKLAAGGREEAPATTFDFIPGRSSAAGVLIFSAEPTAAEVWVVSYQQP